MDRVPVYRSIAEGLGLDPETHPVRRSRSQRGRPTWLAALDVAVMPATRTRHFSYETSPLKVFEYLAAGLPVVAGDLPATRLVLRNGENALLAEPETRPRWPRRSPACSPTRSSHNVSVPKAVATWKA
jgi:glycosyltransferase involved in cell wall biosynthesis